MGRNLAVAQARQPLNKCSCITMICRRTYPRYLRFPVCLLLLLLLLSVLPGIQTLPKSGVNIANPYIYISVTVSGFQLLASQGNGQKSLNLPVFCFRTLGLSALHVVC